MTSKLFFLLIAISFLSSCSSPYTYFTKNLYEGESWSEDDIENIQFYLSKDVVLTRSLGKNETQISEGKIQVVNGRRVERVIIRKNTPGVLIHMPNENRFAISFEESDDDAFLMFGPNEKQNSRYVLLAQEWKRTVGQVHYKGNLYSVDAESAYSSLMVDMRKVGESDYQVHRPSGRTVKP